MASSLSSVVSNLVRASMGNSVPPSVTDDDLDRHVAELIVREAKKKAERYGQQGIRAYISNNIDSNAPKANKRFLSSIIKSTDDHNKTILRAQAQAAQEIKREREEQERRQRRARAAEAAEAERLRRSGRSSKRKRGNDDEGWDRWDGRTAERKKVSRNWENWDGRDEDGEKGERERMRRRRSRSRSPSRSRDNRSEIKSRPHREGDESDGDISYRRRRRHGHSRSSSPARDDSRHDSRHEDSSKRTKRKRSRERSERRSRRPSRSLSPRHRSLSRSSQTDDSKQRKRRRSRSPKYALDDILDDQPPRRVTPAMTDSSPEDKEVDLRQQLKDSRQAEPRRSSPQTDPGPSSGPKVGISLKSVPSRSSSLSSRSPGPGPQLPVQLPSKMDRYFEESYDPRLDVAPLEAPKVPATGLIDNAEFEGWDAMLELIRLRRQDKEDKKRLERLGLLPKEKSKSKKRGVVVDSGPAVADRWSGEAVSVMDIEYKKRGTVREWDLGKEAL